MMSGFFSKLFRDAGKDGASRKIDRAYVSEFTDFIDHFCKDHPEVVRDQWIGREIYWDKKVDFSDEDNAVKDCVPEDGYGFAYSVWSKRHRPSSIDAALPADAVRSGAAKASETRR